MDKTITRKFPVIVFFHDGDFDHGASNQYPFHQLVAWHDLIVVSVNYRIGGLGKSHHPVRHDISWW